MNDYIGFKGIAAHLGIKAVQPLAVESKVGTSRRTVVGMTREETYIAAAKPEATIVGHLAANPVSQGRGKERTSSAPA